MQAGAGCSLTIRCWRCRSSGRPVGLMKHLSTRRHEMKVSRRHLFSSCTLLIGAESRQCLLEDRHRPTTTHLTCLRRVRELPRSMALQRGDYRLSPCNLPRTTCGHWVMTCLWLRQHVPQCRVASAALPGSGRLGKELRRHNHLESHWKSAQCSRAGQIGHLAQARQGSLRANNPCLAWAYNVQHVWRLGGCRVASMMRSGIELLQDRVSPRVPRGKRPISR